MKIAQIEEAMRRGVPFRLIVADGHEYQVPHPDFIFLPPASSAHRSYVIVHHEGGCASVLPLPAITGLRFQVDASK